MGLFQGWKHICRDADILSCAPVPAAPFWPHWFQGKSVMSACIANDDGQLAEGTYRLWVCGFIAYQIKYNEEILSINTIISSQAGFYSVSSTLIWFGLSLFKINVINYTQTCQLLSFLLVWDLVFQNSGGRHSLLERVSDFLALKQKNSGHVICGEIYVWHSVCHT